MSKPRIAASPGADAASEGAAKMTSIDHQNYENAELVEDYVGTNKLEPAEVMIFMKYRDEIVGRRVMDIGCGAGRVTTYLSRWAGHTVGVDFSRIMIEHCRRALPGIEFVCCDVRDLRSYPPRSIDVAVFTFNGIDTLSHEDRLVSFAGLHEVLAENGLLIFSTHNRRYRLARDRPRLRFSRNPFTLLSHGLRFLRETRNHRQRAPFERETDEYAPINDIAHEYRMVHYYIDRETQRRQLASVGFRLLEVYGEDGVVLEGDDDDSASGSLYFVARSV